MNPIKATNNDLQLEDGCCLAIVDDKGQVLQQGDAVNKKVFDAMTEQVIEQFCSRFTAFTKNDFKKAT